MRSTAERETHRWMRTLNPGHNATKCNTRGNDGESMPRDPSLAHVADASLGFGRSVGELRAEFSGALKESRGQVVFVKEGQVDHELCGRLLGQLTGQRHLMWKRRLGGEAGRHFNFAANARDAQSRPGEFVRPCALHVCCRSFTRSLGDV